MFSTCTDINNINNKTAL